jgi:hypothetical protein
LERARERGPSSTKQLSAELFRQLLRHGHRAAERRARGLGARRRQPGQRRVTHGAAIHRDPDASQNRDAERAAAVYAATTRRELDAIIADLPTAIARETTDITATFSGQERKLAGVVLRDLKLRARLGYVELDLTQATFEPGVTTIDVSALMGYGQI